MNREIGDIDGLASQLPKWELDRGGAYEISNTPRRSPYAGVSDDLREYVIGPVNPMVAKLAHQTQEMREEMEVMQMIIRGFGALRKKAKNV